MKHQPYMYTEYSPRNPRSLDSYTPQSSDKVWWECRNGHSWITRVSVRTKGSQCPHCSRSKADIGIDDVTITHPEISAYWNEESSGKYLNVFTKDSVYAAQWKCPRCDKEWKQSIKSFVNSIRIHTDDDCCKHQHQYKRNSSTLTPGKGRSLADLYPDIAVEWDVDRNERAADEVFPASSKTYEWKCSQGHSWSAQIKNRTLNHQGCPYCSGKRFDEERSLHVTHPHLSRQFSPNNPVSVKDLTYGSSVKAEWICKNGHSWTAKVNDRTYLGNGCPHCSRSGPEKELALLVEEMLPDEEIISGSRSVIPPYELDLYVPGRSVAIEFNGLYWHSDRIIPDDYHQKKYEKCRDKGIQLITIWEDQWRYKKAIVDRMLRYKLGVYDGPKVFSRKCDLTILSDITLVKSFMEENHIQGFVGATIHVALEYDSQVVAIGSFTKGKDCYSLVRYATNCSVPGGMSRIVSYFLSLHPQVTLYSFADHCVSDGSLYRRNGWVVDAELPPDYQYVVNRKRRHKFGYRLNRFKTDPHLIYEEGMTEKELAALNGLHRVFDCGKTKYRYN